MIGRSAWVLLATLAAAGSTCVAAEPRATRACAGCHADVAARYAGHGMARSLGPLGAPPAGSVANPRSGVRYELWSDADGAWLAATHPDGGQRLQRLVGRIGAGLFDTSWIGEEVDVLDRTPTGRLFFAPVESLAESPSGHGDASPRLELSPFELDERPQGLDLALTEGCLTCHTLTRPAELPDAAPSPAGGDPYPPNALGGDAFAHLEPLGCDACHGDGRAHAERMARPDGPPPTDLADLAVADLAIADLAALPAGAQRDVCARCHLQGDARLDLVRGRPRRDRPLAAQIPVLVPRRQPADHRFVGQLERLALSPCFRGSPEMTCTTCHLPHRGVRAQGIESFERACATCHSCARPPAPAAGATSRERRGAGCVDCHLRRSQPFDLPGIRTTDHHIRRRPPPPSTAIPHRAFADPGGELEIFDDGRLAPLLAAPGGERWRAGVEAMGLLSTGRTAAAARLFAAFPEPGTAAARRPTAPPGLEPLARRADFHQARALALLASGRPRQALAAFDDALALDPLAPGARLGRARLRLERGDVAGALTDTQAVIEAYPRAEDPWRLRATLAERRGRPDLVVAALEAVTRRWPSRAEDLHRLALLLERHGDPTRARAAHHRARLLRPSLYAAPPRP